MQSCRQLADWTDSHMSASSRDCPDTTSSTCSRPGCEISVTSSEKPIAGGGLQGSITLCTSLWYQGHDLSLSLHVEPPNWCQECIFKNEIHKEFEEKEDELDGKNLAIYRMAHGKVARLLFQQVPHSELEVNPLPTSFVTCGPSTKWNYPDVRRAKRNQPPTHRVMSVRHLDQPYGALTPMQSVLEAAGQS
uniref:Uncharacterized protein n=1 Tax=Timema genevievae TaxID=629358 RepID=A0A7R9K748_TIMGE|nr:unnamed protein product [Timema genevievae]